MRSAALRLLRSRKTFYLTFVIASVFLIVSLFLSFFTNSFLGLIGVFFILSVAFYTVSWLSYVWIDRRSNSALMREGRALRKEIVENDKSIIKELSDSHEKLYRIIEQLENDLEITLNNYQKSYLEQLKIQAFNSHLAVQDLKSSIFTERDTNE